MTPLKSTPQHLPAAPLEAALQKAAQEAVLDHARAGLPVAETRDGQTVWVPPDEVLKRFGSENTPAKASS